ncbi:MAG: hypothetical protein GXO86_07620 [Chlorobi bacterium]|nr:hypothetical protein [Chlorobiota bacterium]
MLKITHKHWRVCILLLFSPLTGLFAFTGEEPEIDLKQPHSTDRDSLRVAELCDQVAFYNRIKNDNRKVDSIGKRAVELATSTFRPGLILMAYNSYIENIDLLANQAKALDYALAAEQISSTVSNISWQWKCALNLAQVYMWGNDYDKALGSAYKSLTLASDMNNDAGLIESYLMIGKILERNNRKVEAFRNYLQATKLARQSQDDGLLTECYSELSGFYLANRLFQKAATYKLLQQSMLIKTKPVDSLALMWISYDLQVINLSSDKTIVNEPEVSRVLAFAKRHDNSKLRDYEFSLYRSVLTKLNRMDLLKQFYMDQYPEEFHKLKLNSPSFYYRLKAYFNEYEGKADSADFYFTEAEKYISDNSNKILQSNFYLRFGQFLIRSGDDKTAIRKLEHAYLLAREANYLKFMLDASLLLEKLFAGEEKFRQAYYYSNLNRKLNDSINRLAGKDKLIRLEINHEAQQQALAEKRERLETQRRHNLQYTAIVVAILSIFVILILLGSFKVPRWVIQALGFISFIFLFEFIILLADQKIHHLTHGEPWKILLIKIGLIAILLPFHHWIERKVVHKLISQRLIKFDSFSIWDLLKKMTSRKGEAIEKKL